MEELEHLGLNLSWPHLFFGSSQLCQKPKNILSPFTPTPPRLCANLAFNYKLWRAVRSYKNHSSVGTEAERTFTLFLNQSVNQWKLLLYSALRDIHPKVNYSEREIICSFFISVFRLKQYCSTFWHTIQDIFHT